jgi:hypothetical protein
VNILVSTAFLLLAQAGEGLQTGYQILVDVMTIATFAPFIYIFGAAFRLGGRWAGLMGAAVTALAIILASIPPAEAEPWRYMAKVIGGCVLLTLLGRWLYMSSLRPSSTGALGYPRSTALTRIVSATGPANTRARVSTSGRTPR